MNKLLVYILFTFAIHINIAAQSPNQKYYVLINNVLTGVKIQPPYTSNQIIKWSNSSSNAIPVEINLQICPSELNVSEARNLIEGGRDIWTNISGGCYGFIEPDPNFPLNSVRVMFTQSEQVILGGGGSVGSTGALTVHAVENGQIVSFTTNGQNQGIGRTEIIINDCANFNYYWDHDDTKVFDSDISLKQVSMHEFGHVIGLSHNDNSNAMMYESINPSEPYKLNLASEDINAATYLCGLTTGGTGAITFSPAPGTYSIDEGERLEIQMSTTLPDAKYIWYNNKGGEFSTYVSTCEELPECTPTHVQQRYGWYNSKPRFYNGGTFAVKAAVEKNDGTFTTPSDCGIWTVDVVTGIEDYLFIYDGPDVIFPNYLFIFRENFIDNYPYGDYIVGNTVWSLYAFHSGGEYYLGIPQWFDDLPTGYCWQRDANGNVVAEVRVSGIDNDNTYHVGRKTVGISGVPGPTTSGTLTSDEVWCATTSIYGDVIVPAGITLRIESGANITFYNGSSLIVNGSLVVDGGTTYYNFLSQNTSTQNGIKINAGATATISYAVITNGYYGIYANEDDVNIYNCNISGCKYGIYLYNTDSYPNDIWIQNNRSYDNEFGIVLYGSSPIIKGNTLYNNWRGVGCADMSSPYFGGVSSGRGENHIYNNDIGVYAYNNSNPFLGRNSCTTNGGYNKIENNVEYELFAHTNCYILAENNWWGTSTPSASKVYGYLDCTVDFDPWLTSPPAMLAKNKMISPEEQVFNDNLLKISAEEPKKTGVKVYDYDEEWPIEWKLLYARNLIDVKDYSFAYEICKEIINNEPKSEFALYALDLLNRAGRKLDKSQFESDLNTISNRKHKYKINGYAGVLNSSKDKSTKATKLNKILNDYKNKEVTEYALFELFLHYFHSGNNQKATEKIAKRILRDFANSEIARLVQSHLGDSAPTLHKKNLGNDDSLPTVITEFKLLGNFPNPFNPSTNITFALPFASNVVLKIFDTMGREVYRTALDGLSEGVQQITWNGKNNSGNIVASGTYIYTLDVVGSGDKAKSYKASSKLLFIK